MNTSTPVADISADDVTIAAPLLAPALAASGAGAVAVMSGVAVLLPTPPAAETPAVSLLRYLGNDFCLAILTLGLWALLYALLQIQGARQELATLAGATGSRFLRRLTGAHARAALLAHAPVADAMLRAGVSADRLDTHQRLRAAPLSYAIWVLPLMGFIGTVVGISGAIGGLGSVFGEAGREQALGEVLGHLRYAFDTTFVGLAAVIPIMALATFQRTLADRVRHQVVTHALRSATVEPRR